MNEMKIKSIAPWFGSKRTLAPLIVQELGPHRCYWEPFCGSMAVLLSKQESRMETVNDLHGDVVNLARVIAHPTLGPRLYRQLRRQIVADELLLDCDRLIRGGDYEGSEPDIERARAFFVTSWMGRNGEVGLAKQERGRQLAVRWTPNGGDSATRYGSAVESLPAWRRRLRSVVVLRRDAFEVIGKIRDEEGTAVYVDPPYLQKSDRYLYDFQEGFMGVENDHERLAAALRRFRRARVVVSYYEHPALRHLYPGWTERAVHLNKNMSAVTGGAPAKTAPEVLIINGPSLALEAA